MELAIHRIDAWFPVFRFFVAQFLIVQPLETIFAVACGQAAEHVVLGTVLVASARRVLDSLGALFAECRVDISRLALAYTVLVVARSDRGTEAARLAFLTVGARLAYTLVLGNAQSVGNVDRVVWLANTIVHAAVRLPQVTPTTWDALEVALDVEMFDVLSQGTGAHHGQQCHERWTVQVCPAGGGRYYGHWQ